MTSAMLSVDEIPGNGSVFIFGTGSVGRGLADILGKTRPDVGITFLDSFIDGVCQGHTVVKFNSFVQTATTGEAIIIASSFWKEIADTLENAGFKNIRQALGLFELHDRGLIVRLV